jgi:hypothetical protein
MDFVLRPGMVLAVGGAASVQFAASRALRFRVIRVDERATYDGWVWIDGYVLDQSGAARERRTIFVRKAGLQVAEDPRAARAAARR